MVPNEPNFQNWLKTHPKVLNAYNKRALDHFGGMLALKSGLVFFSQRSENGQRSEIVNEVKIVKVMKIVKEVEIVKEEKWSKK